MRTHKSIEEEFLYLPLQGYFTGLSGWPGTGCLASGLDLCEKKRTALEELSRREAVQWRRRFVVLSGFVQKVEFEFMADLLPIKRDCGV